MLLKNIRQRANENLISNANNKSRAICKATNSERAPCKKYNEYKWELEVAGETNNEIDKVVDHFNDFFVNIADETIIKNNFNNVVQASPTALGHCNIPTLSHFLSTNSEEVVKTVDNMKSKASAAFDDISSKILKTCKNVIALPLTNIINKSLLQGTLPSRLKISKLYPLHKSGCRKELKNFRPISLVPTVSKIIEKIVLSRLLNHLQENFLLTKNQHGFIAG